MIDIQLLASRIETKNRKLAWPTGLQRTQLISAKVYQDCDDFSERSRNTEPTEKVIQLLIVQTKACIKE